MKKLLKIEIQHYMSQEETSCHRKKLPVTGRNSMSQEETHSIRNLVSQEDGSCHTAFKD
jgi:hypothetical protein